MSEKERCHCCGQVLPKVKIIKVGDKEVPAQMQNGKLFPVNCAGLKCRDCMRCV